MSSILTNESILYEKFLKLFADVKLVQGGNSLASTIRRHKKIKDFMINHQKAIINDLESEYFLPDGSVDLDALENIK